MIRSALTFLTLAALTVAAALTALFAAASFVTRTSEPFSPTGSSVPVRRR